ncbi:star protein [Aphis craccivora]|uniref:Star protein n=1 Tax=Aphis craccivora TaxID=307492 RepID=A0A6G0ZBL3_APHCR|nr:star protein [Aphis craccivora]
MVEMFKTYYSYSKVLIFLDSDLNGPEVFMDNSNLVKKLQNNFLIRPIEENKGHRNRYNLIDMSLRDPSMGQASEISKIIDYKKGGFFIECGALDGETRSNTLFFERFYGWTGLLIEADPLNFAKMLKKGRRAYLSPTCLSINPYPEIVSFLQRSNMGRIAYDEVVEDFVGINDIGKKKLPLVNVQCFPFYTYLLALNITVVDYFSLDVEGSELNVLKTIPFDKVDIKTLSVEFFHVKEGDDGVRTYLENKGYIVTGKVTRQDRLANDYIFAKPSILSQNVSFYVTE